jgi:dTDP-4-dehydrorhamnose reductase
LRKLWESGKITKLSTDQFNTPIYAGNLAEAVLELTKTDFTGIIHLAGSERISRFQLGLLLAKQFRINKKLIQPVKISEVKSIGIRPVDVSLKIDLAQNLLKTEFLNCWEGIQSAYPQN